MTSKQTSGCGCGSSAAAEKNLSACCPPAEQTPCCPEEQPTATSCCSPDPAIDTICGSPTAADNCCAPALRSERPGYRLEPYVCDWIQSPMGKIPKVATQLTQTDQLGALQMRWGINRDRYTVTPGLYAVGNPEENSPVLVSANYKLSFDALRKELTKIDAWILVIDTKGINVWCAAGKGTFGTAEITHRVKTSRLADIVSHRQLIVPQLGAPGIAAHQVTKQTGFKVSYGPVRASDLPAFLLTGKVTTSAMRRVTFSTRERLILTPVELVMMKKISSWTLLALILLGGIGPSIYSLGGMWHRGLAAAVVYLAGVIVGAVLTPILLPWIPGAALAWKGALSGFVAALLSCGLFATQLEVANSVALLFSLPAVASYCAMNFTGSTTYTSPSGVETEMRRAIPLQALAVLIAGVAWFWGAFTSLA